MPVLIVTDASAVMPRVWIDRYDIRVIPLDLAWHDGSISPGAVPYSDVADRIVAAPEPPKTGSPSPGSFEQIFDDADKVGDRVVVVCPPPELSTTYNSAVLAARMRGSSTVRVIDARTAAAGQAIVAYEAAKAAAAGRELEAVVERAVSVARRVEIWATLMQVEFLRRSGRIPAVAAFGANALRLQPIVRYAGGSPVLAGVSRSGKSAAQRLTRQWERSFVGGTSLRFVAFHSARRDDAERACARVRDLVGEAAEVHAVEVPALMGAHTGPGLLGLAWFWDN